MEFDVIEKGKDYEVSTKVWEGNPLKIFKSKDANYIFDLKTGRMMLWGKDYDEDPSYFPAPNILDMEITTKCNGGCPFCYKSNTTFGKNMSFETFKKIFDTLPKSITQIAFGADRDLSSNPDLISMMEYAKSQGVIPNITAAYITDEMADVLSEVCGAVAISRYGNKDECYDSIKRLTDRGMTQVNIHLMVSEETYDRCMETINDASSDPRLENLNAIVCLCLKQKGRGEDFHVLSDEKFKRLVNLARENKIGLGFDSCSSLKALRVLGEEVQKYVLDCEASLQSSYINVDGNYYPCSFCEGEREWKEGLNVLKCNNPQEFVDKIWNHPKTEEFRKKLMASVKCNEFDCRECPMFKV